MSKWIKYLLTNVTAGIVVGILIISTIILSGYLIYGWDFETFRWSLGLFNWGCYDDILLNTLHVIINNFTLPTIIIGSMVALLLVRLSYLSYFMSYLVVMISMKMLMKQPGYDLYVIVLEFFFVFILSFIIFIPSLLIKTFAILPKKERNKSYENLKRLTHLSIIIYLLLGSLFLFYASVTPICKSILDNNSLGLSGYVLTGFLSIASGVIVYWIVKNIILVVKKKPNQS